MAVPVAGFGFALFATLTDAHNAIEGLASVGLTAKLAQFAPSVRYIQQQMFQDVAVEFVLSNALSSRSNCRAVPMPHRNWIPPTFTLPTCPRK